MGKTNLLDAVYTLCIGKSAFSLGDQELIRQGSDFFRLEGTFIKGERTERIAIKYQPGKRKEIERNGVPYRKIGEHIGLLPVVMIAPEDIRIARDSSDYRRKFMDFTLSQVNAVYLQHLMTCQKLTEQRNALLRKEQSADTRLDVLEAIDRQLIEPSAYVCEQRKAFCTAFLPLFSNYYSDISSAREQASIQYESELLSLSIQHILLRNRPSDQAAGRTTGGIHRDDLLMTLGDMPLKKYGSQGQIKSFILALKLAQFEYLRIRLQETPILLLDDIFDKLDENRVMQIMLLLKNRNFGQVMITDTHEGRLARMAASLHLPCTEFRVNEGHTTPIWPIH